jgi:hypothetical protein
MLRGDLMARDGREALFSASGGGATWKVFVTITVTPIYEP